MTKALPLAHELLQRALPPADADHYHEDRVIKRPLYLRPSSPERSARADRRNARNEKKENARKRNGQKPRPLSAKQKRSLGLLEMPTEQIKWDIYLPLHNLWLGYMRDVLGVADPGRPAFVTPASAGPLVVSADMHGALLEIVKSRCVSRVQLKGIVVRDSQFMFEIVTKGNAVRRIPKEHTTFRFEIPLPTPEGSDTAPKPLVFEINGEQFQHRATDRANKKYKMHYQPDL